MLLVRLLVGRRTEHCLISITVGNFKKSCDRPVRLPLYASVYSLILCFQSLSRSYVFLRLICIARRVRSISICFRGTKYETFREHFTLILALKAVTPRPGCDLNCLQAEAGRFLPRISYHLSWYVFLRKCLSFTLRKLYVPIDKL